MNKEKEHADEKASSIAGEVLGSIRMIVACGAEGRIARKYSGWVEEAKRRGFKLSPFVGLQFAPLFFTVYATMALCFWFGFKLYLQHHISSVGTIVIVLMSVMMTAFSLSQTAGPIIAITKAATAATDFFAIIDIPKQVTTGLKAPDASASENITFNSVTFAYPSRPHVKVLDDLSMTIEAGKITAIVGASGSGKSTIVGLIERWYELDESKRQSLPESVIKDKKAGEGKETIAVVEEAKTPIPLGGSVFIGDKDLERVDLKWWRSQIGLVQQEPFIFNDTIRRNVEYGLMGSIWENESTETKKALVEDACREAFADEFITRLPLGYETQVGDAGIKLSGGQRQRLAIARSIIKRPKVLILDEATSSIDVRGERLVQAALDKVSEGRTTITIAHRLSTIKKADKIIVLRKGRVVEQGTHDGLLANEGGAYWALVNAQQLSMGDGFQEESDLIESSTVPLARGLSAASGEAKTNDEVAWKPKSFAHSFGLLLFEQTGHWPWYLMLLVGCASAGAANPVQAYLFAQIIHVITYTGQQLQNASSHWALMFFILAITCAAAYFVLGFSATTISVVGFCSTKL
jgi:ABC-type multidrug transport system fused ATPase/permease subunit